MKNDPKNNGKRTPSILKNESRENGGVGEMALPCLAESQKSKSTTSLTLQTAPNYRQSLQQHEAPS